MTTAGVPVPPAERRPRLLLLLASADHPHRDAVCATLAWVAEAEGVAFECYYDGRRSGTHYGGGNPADADPADLRGGSFTGGHHLEQLYLLLQRFRCEAACLGPTSLAAPLAELGVPVRARSGDVARFYEEVFATSPVDAPPTLLVVGDGPCEGVRLAPYAYPEVVSRRLLAISAGDPDARAELALGRSVETLWAPAAERWEATEIAAPQSSLVAEQTAWMAERWAHLMPEIFLGDPELVGHWMPTLARHRRAPVFGMPQVSVIERLAERLGRQTVVFGRQQDDRDFLALSRLGTAFQLVDPGRPPFPVLREAPGRWPPPAVVEEPTDDQLRAWSEEGRVLTSLLFWTGMVRELECLYALADLLSLSGLAAGWVLTTESYAHMSQPPLSLVEVSREMGGLAPRVELLLASGGVGALLESAAPPERFAATLRASVEDLGARLGGAERVPRGWWGTMDAPLVFRGTPRVEVRARAPYVAIRHRPRSGGGGAGANVAPRAADRLRSRVRRSPLRHLFEPVRPFDDYLPGPPQRALLEAVRDAGFEYALTKSSFGGLPRVVRGVEGLTVLTYTTGRWDGWTPFVTINDLSDLRRSERRLLRSNRPGWLVGTFDSCLWAFTGPRWDRGAELDRICRWTAGGGSSGRLVNVTPRTVARYARMLAERGMVDALDAE